MNRDELRRRLEPFTREWGTVHGNIDEVLDAILGGQADHDDIWNNIMRKSLTTGAGHTRAAMVDRCS